MNPAWERRRLAGLFCPLERRLAGKMPALPAEHLGSWSQCMRKNEWRLSMNGKVAQWGRHPACRWGVSPQNPSRARRPRWQPGRLPHYQAAGSRRT